MEIIKETVKTHKRIIFDGDGYSSAWREEAEKRGLLNLKSTVDAIPYLTKEENVHCKKLGDDYISLIKDVGNREALTRRFFLIFEYESPHRAFDDFGMVYSVMQTAEQNARAYFALCGNSILQPI